MYGAQSAVRSSLSTGKHFGLKGPKSMAQTLADPSDLGAFLWSSKGASLMLRYHKNLVLILKRAASGRKMSINYTASSTLFVIY